MPKIFISYRRADSQDITERIHDHMAAHFGEDNVFQDVDSIPFGVDFRQHLSSEINQCDVVLVIVGPEWSRHMQERAREPNDFVRVEVESALKLDKLVIPVLVRAAHMPLPDDLPEGVRDLCWLNAAPVRPNPDFRRDCQILAEGIQKAFADKPLDTPVKQPALKSRVPELLPPPFEWVQIPGGKLFLEAGGYVPQTGADFTVSDFYIAKYPVTNAQFEEFVDAKDGWYDPQWWEYSEAAKAWRRTQTAPQAPAFGGIPDHPRVNVTWYEAAAFCQWLSGKTGEKITLPSEQRWQRAAVGDTGWAYPWGNIADGSECNVSSDQTTPVTQFEGKGDSPFGVVDMSGNVWEWCATGWSSGRQDFVSGDNARALRGGSWNHSRSGARATSRNNYRPDFQGLVIGFRCALA